MGEEPVVLGVCQFPSLLHFLSKRTIFCNSLTACSQPDISCQVVLFRVRPPRNFFCEGSLPAWTFGQVVTPRELRLTSSWEFNVGIGAKVKDASCLRTSTPPKGCRICSSAQLSGRPLTRIQGAKHHLTIDAIMCVQHKHRTGISRPDWMGSHWQPMPPCHWQAMQMTTMTSPSHCMKALFLHKVIKLQA